MKNEKRLIIAARAVSLFFTPFYLPIVGMLVLFTFSFMSIFPTAYKLIGFQEHQSVTRQCNALNRS